MKDSNFIKFQDDFYDLLIKYGVHEDYCTGWVPYMFNKVCSVRDNLVSFIDKLKREELSDLEGLSGKNLKLLKWIQENGQR